MMSNRIIIAIVIIGAFLAGVVTLYLFNQTRNNSQDTTSNVTSTPGVTSSPASSAEPVTNTTPNSTAPATSPSATGTVNITVSSPKSGETVGRPFTVRGTARTFEQSVSFRLKQADGKVLVEDFTTATAPDLGMFGPYEKTLNYPRPTQQNGILEVFENSAKDGSEINKVTVPVKFSDYQN